MFCKRLNGKCQTTVVFVFLLFFAGCGIDMSYPPRPGLKRLPEGKQPLLFVNVKLEVVGDPTLLHHAPSVITLQNVETGRITVGNKHGFMDARCGGGNICWESNDNSSSSIGNSPFLISVKPGTYMIKRVSLCSFSYDDIDSDNLNIEIVVKDQPVISGGTLHVVLELTNKNMFRFEYKMKCTHKELDQTGKDCAIRIHPFLSDYLQSNK